MLSSYQHHAELVNHHQDHVRGRSAAALISSDFFFSIVSKHTNQNSTSSLSLSLVRAFIESSLLSWAGLAMFTALTVAYWVRRL
jgi:hypothetical protein